MITSKTRQVLQKADFEGVYSKGTHISTNNSTSPTEPTYKVGEVV